MKKEIGRMERETSLQQYDYTTFLIISVYKN